MLLLLQYYRYHLKNFFLLFSSSIFPRLLVPLEDVKAVVLVGVETDWMRISVLVTAIFIF
jgi:hypothetical protein